jgi:hypothetical protein
MRVRRRPVPPVVRIDHRVRAAESPHDGSNRPEIRPADSRVQVQNAMLPDRRKSLEEFGDIFIVDFSMHAIVFAFGHNHPLR